MPNDFLDKALDFVGRGWVQIVVGIAIAYISYKRGQRSSKVIIDISANHELTWNNAARLPPAFELTFHGENIPRVSRGLCRLWNGGNDTILQDRVTLHNPVRLRISGGKFLTAAVLKRSNEANLASCSIDADNPSILSINFDYFDPKEGALIAFIHTGEDAKPSITGSIRGCPIIDINASNVVSGSFFSTFRTRSRRLRQKLAWTLLGVGILGFALSLSPEPVINSITATRAQKADVSEAERMQSKRIAVAVVSMTYILLGGGFLWARRRRYPSALSWPGTDSLRR